MSRPGPQSEADGTSLNTSDRGQPVVTYVRVGRGMVKVTKYEKQDKVAREERKRTQLNDAGSIHSFDSSQPTPRSVPSVKSRASSSHTRGMPAWVSKFKKSKKGKKDAVPELPPIPSGLEMPRDPFSRAPSTSQYHEGRSAHPTRSFVEDLEVYDHESTRRRAASVEPPRAKEPSPELPEDDSDDSALAYLQALGLEPAENAPKTKPERQPKLAPTASTQTSSQSRSQPGRAATLPIPPPAQPQSMRYPADEVPRLDQTRHDALIASITNPPPTALEQYASRHVAPRPDYITTARRAPSNDALGLIVDPPSSRSQSPQPGTLPVHDISPAPSSPSRKSQRRDLPPRPPPPSTFAPYAPADSVAPPNGPRVQNSPKLLPPESPYASGRASPAPLSRASSQLRPQGSPMSLAPPPSNPPRGGSVASQLALPLVRVRITSPPHRGALRALPALIMLSVGARASFAAATWAQMVAYCARNAGVAFARRGGGGTLRVSVEERMAELMTPGGGRGPGDEEVGFGLGYYVSVEMVLEGEGPIDEHQMENSVPVAVISIPLPTTMGEVATMFRERKDIRKALT
ncbi:hypothetical protein FRC07_008124 [Ceratobasidium sp. 392]|nr:hypothetical protein FRC07_008124 [Ceratobasidium sp. 392]